MATRRNPGFTLVELVTTVAILFIMLAVATPVLQSTIAQRRLTSALERIAGDIRSAQSMAVREGNLHRFLTDGAGQYRLERNAGAWAAVMGWYNLSSDYRGSSLQSVRDNGGGALTNITFNSRGAVDVTTGAASYPITLTVAALSGATRTVQVLRSGVVRIP
ncbi:MAG TPA: GspH/FimT family pseudopilin [Candidatus Methylomirabilis sp.]|nr:GspH/FimT family pseudopilin [Candidatus Methylomirabilis sp.]